MLAQNAHFERNLSLGNSSFPEKLTRDGRAFRFRSQTQRHEHPDKLPTDPSPSPLSSHSINHVTPPQ